MKNKQKRAETIEKLWKDVNAYLIQFNLHISKRLFADARIDRKCLVKDLKKIEKHSRILGLTHKEFKNSIRQ